jgi:erythromycin 3''-O-methyltransferase
VGKNRHARYQKKMMEKAIRMVTTSDDGDRIRQFYELIPPREEFASRTTTYMNMGYWTEGCTNLDSAAAALAVLLGDAAGFEAGDAVLDVGFGYGDQDFDWLRDKNIGRVSGLNITPHHVKAARKRARREGLSDRLDFQLGSATEMPFQDGTFDRVVSLESAFHFYPRRDFFSEAYRVLRPGGTIAAADIIPVDGATPRMEFASLPLGWVKFGIGDENWYDSHVYVKELADSGFTDIHIESIRDQVYEPWRAAMASRTEDPALRDKMGAEAQDAMRGAWSDESTIKGELALLDYVIAVARKPA